MPKLIQFYHEKEDAQSVHLTKQEEDDLAADWEDIKNQRDYRDAQVQKWRWAGSVYNVLQSAQADDRLSNITLGWIRSYIDTGIAQMTAGEPDFDYEALGPSDESRTLLWKELVKTVMGRSNYGSHQKIAMTDAHVFGPGVFEVFQQRPYRTIRVPEGNGYRERVILDHRLPRVGVRAVSPFRVTRNPNVSDPNEVGSCTKEEILSWNQFVAKYGRALDSDGKAKYKHTDCVPRGSHVKITIYQDEIRDVYRIYALSYGTANDGQAETAPQGLGIPIFDRPLKIHDVYGPKKELQRSVGLNIPGMCNLVFLPYADKLNNDFETHDIYGMGLPEHMEGLDTFMQTAFNMTVDNWRLGNTVVLNYKSPDGTVPDFDANTYYGGEFVNADVSSTTLGQDRTVNFDNMYEIIQKVTIPATGININQIAGDTSRTAFEFQQRIEANNKRSEMRLKEWEAGPFKRLGTLLLSAAISELTVHDLEDIREQDAKTVLQDIQKGLATKDDFTFKDGKPAQRKIRYYIDMKGMKENFTKSKSRKINPDATDNTLVKDRKNPEAMHKIQVTEEYVFPAWYVESGVLFDTRVDSKRMLTNRVIRDTQSINAILQNIIALAQFDPTLIQQIDSAKWFAELLKLADMEPETILKTDGDTELGRLQQQVKKLRDSLLSPPQDAMAEPPNSPQPGPIGAGQAVPPVPQQAPAPGAL